MLNEVWAQRRLALTTLTKTAVCLCYVVALNKHCPTHAHSYTSIFTHTEPACFCVFWSGADRAPVVWSGSATHMLSVYVVLTGLLWSASRWPNTIWNPSTLILSPSPTFFLFFTPKHFISCSSVLKSHLIHWYLLRFNRIHSKALLCLCLGCRHILSVMSNTLLCGV